MSQVDCLSADKITKGLTKAIFAALPFQPLLRVKNLAFFQWGRSERMVFNIYLIKNLSCPGEIKCTSQSYGLLQKGKFQT